MRKSPIWFIDPRNIKKGTGAIGMLRNRMLLIVMIFCSLIYLSPAIDAAGVLEIVVIDVGQGDSILIITPERRIVLIDLGQSSKTGSIVEILHSKGIKGIDVLIISHPHIEHLGNIIEVLSAFSIGRILDSGATTSTISYGKYTNAVAQHQIPIELARSGYRFDFDEVHFEVLNPSEPLTDSVDDSSIVVRLSYNDFSAIFTGDISSKGEQALLKQGMLQHVDLLKISRHGSYDASSQEFLEALKPTYAVIPVGIGNRYDHPHEETLNRLDLCGIKVYRTDLNGNITFQINGSSVTITTEKAP